MSTPPHVTFDPSGDGTYRVRCCDCRALVPSDRAHIVKANNVSGRANRCDDCGQAAHRRIWAFNFTRRSGLTPRPVRRPDTTDPNERETP